MIDSAEMIAVRQMSFSGKFGDSNSAPHL